MRRKAAGCLKIESVGWAKARGTRAVPTKRTSNTSQRCSVGFASLSPPYAFRASEAPNNSTPPAAVTRPAAIVTTRVATRFTSPASWLT